MAQRFVGVDLGTHHVKVVVATSGLRGVQVLRLYEEAVEIGPDGGAGLEEAVGVAISVLRAHDLAGDTVGVSLPGSAGSYRLLQFPFTDARRIAQAVSFEVDGQFPVPLEQLRYDHVVTPALGDAGRALVVAVNDARARAVADAFTEAGIRVKLITTAPLALAQALEPRVAPIVFEDGEVEDRMAVTLVVDIGHRTTELTAISEKGPVMARTLRMGGRDVTHAIMEQYRLDAMAAENSKHRDGFVPHRGMGDMTPDQLASGTVVARAVEVLVREIEHTRLWLHSSHGYEVTGMIVAGGGSRLNGLAGYLEEQVGLPVQPVGELITSIVKSEKRDWTDHAVALGTAVATARRPLVQLHRSAGGGDDNSFVQQRISALIGIGVAIMAFGALDTIAQIKALDAELEVRQAELATASRAVFGKEITDTGEIDALLSEVDAQDLTSLVPTHGALDLLGQITDAARPQDADKARPAPPPAVAPGPDGESEEDDSQAEDGTASSEEDTDGDESAAGANKALSPIADASAGIFLDDELVFSVVDIRPLKVDIKVTSTRSSAQDRLAIKLGELGCLTNVTKGKVRDQNDRKVFEMSMDNGCFMRGQDQGGEG